MATENNTSYTAKLVKSYDDHASEAVAAERSRWREVVDPLVEALRRMADCHEAHRTGGLCHEDHGELVGVVDFALATARELMGKQ